MATYRGSAAGGGTAGPTGATWFTAVPAGTIAGDWLYIAVLANGAITPAAGWTEVASITYAGTWQFRVYEKQWDGAEFPSATVGAFITALLSTVAVDAQVTYVDELGPTNTLGFDTDRPAAVAGAANGLNFGWATLFGAGITGWSGATGVTGQLSGSFGLWHSGCYAWPNGYSSGQTWQTLPDPVDWIGASLFIEDLACLTAPDFVPPVDPEPDPGAGGNPVTRTRVAPKLLCARYEVAIVDRRNRASVVRLPDRGWDLTFTRRLDAVSDASLTIDTSPGGVGDACCDRLGYIGEWMHELIVWREGSPQEVWVGPVVKRRDSPGKGKFTVTAKDRSTWWWRRPVLRDIVRSGSSKVDAAVQFVELLWEAEQRDAGPAGRPSWALPYDPVGLRIDAAECGVLVDGKTIVASDIVLVGPEIESLARSSIDWTVVGRRCYAGGSVVNLAPLPVLAQEHWIELDPEIESDGEVVAAQVQVIGARGVWAEWPSGPVNPRWPAYGSHLVRISDSKLETYGEAQARARTEWEARQQPRVTIVSGSGSLGERAPVSVDDLIPGRVVPVGISTSCLISPARVAQVGRQFVAYDSGVRRAFIAEQRLHTVTVNVSDGDEVAVKVDLGPIGTTELRRAQATVAGVPRRSEAER